MKKTTFYISLLFITLLSFTCKKTPQPDPLPSVIYVSGVVTEKQTSIGLDSVNVSLTHKVKGNITGLYLTKNEFTTDKNGKYSFQFSQDVKYSYALDFSKKNYRSYPSLT